jgi:hypothetical protein
VPEGKRALREAFKRLEGEVPERGARLLRRLRHPDARLIRIPIGLLCIVGGIFSFLPVLGIWMLPLGLLLIALDVPFLRKPVAYSTIWGMRKWASFRLRLARRWRSSGRASTADAKLSARESGSRSGPT